MSQGVSYNRGTEPIAYRRGQRRLHQLPLLLLDSGRRLTCFPHPLRAADVAVFSTGSCPEANETNAAATIIDNKRAPGRPRHFRSVFGFTTFHDDCLQVQNF